MSKVCIVGAGTGGLCSARHALNNNIEPTIFEQTSAIGGTWVYTDQIGVDEYGIDVHSSMYQGLRTNLPKEIMGFPDFPIPPHKDSYIPSKDMLNFLEQYADHFQLKNHIKFLHYVIRIAPRGSKWEVYVKDLQNSTVIKYIFDYVMICNGHYHTPQYPTVTGSDIFKGKLLHSHDYRTPKAFKDDNVLIIGAGPSGMDLCHEISKFANRVTLSHHMKEKPKTKFLENVTQKPDVKGLDERGALFTDGSYITFNVILYCTGFKYAFPFLSVDCGIHVDENFVQPLYKHCININYPTMSFIGLPFYVCASQMMDLQVRFFMEYATGRQNLPSRTDMIIDTNNEMEKRWKNGLQKRQAHMMGTDQAIYYDDLADTAKITHIKPVMWKIHNESSQSFLDDLVNFRQEIFEIVNDTTFKKVN